MMMKNDRFKFPKWTVTVFTFVLLVILVLSYFIFYVPDVGKCSKLLLFSEGIALILQLILNRINWKSNLKIVILATLFISASILASVIWRLITYHLICA